MSACVSNEQTSTLHNPNGARKRGVQYGVQDSNLDLGLRTPVSYPIGRTPQRCDAWDSNPDFEVRTLVSCPLNERRNDSTCSVVSPRPSLRQVTVGPDGERGRWTQRAGQQRTERTHKRATHRRVGARDGSVVVRNGHSAKWLAPTSDPVNVDFQSARRLEAFRRALSHRRPPQRGTEAQPATRR